MLGGQLVDQPMTHGGQLAGDGFQVVEHLKPLGVRQNGKGRRGQGLHVGPAQSPPQEPPPDPPRSSRYADGRFTSGE